MGRNRRCPSNRTTHVLLDRQDNLPAAYVAVSLFHASGNVYYNMATRRNRSVEVLMVHSVSEPICPQRSALPYFTPRVPGDERWYRAAPPLRSVVASRLLSLPRHGNVIRRSILVIASPRSRAGGLRSPHEGRIHRRREHGRPDVPQHHQEQRARDSRPRPETRRPSSVAWMPGAPGWGPSPRRRRFESDVVFTSFSYNSRCRVEAKSMEGKCHDIDSADSKVL